MGDREFEYVPTVEEYRDGLAATPGLSYGVRYTLGFLILPLLAGAYGAWKNPAEAWTFAGLGAVWATFVLACALAWWWRMIHTIRAEARRQAAAMRAENCRIHITPDGIETRARSATVALKWNAFTATVETRLNMILRVRGAGMVVLPLRYLDEPTRRFITEAVRSAASTTGTSSGAL